MHRQTSGPDGEEVFRKLQVIQQDSAQLLRHMTGHLQSASQHPDVKYLISRELDVAVGLSQIISDQLQIIPGDLQGFINSHLRLLDSYKGTESQMSELKQQRDAAVRDLKQAREMSTTSPSEAMADKRLDEIIKPSWRSGEELKWLRMDSEELYDRINFEALKAKQPWRYEGMSWDMYQETCIDHEGPLKQPRGRHQGPQEPKDSRHKATDSRQTEPGNAKDSGQNQAGKGKDGRQDLSPGQKKVEQLNAELKRVQIAYEIWVEGPGRHLVADDTVSDGGAPSCWANDASNLSKAGTKTGSKRGFESGSESGQEDYSDSGCTDTSDSDVTSEDESGSEDHEAAAVPDAVSRLIHSAVSNDLNAGEFSPSHVHRGAYMHVACKQHK